MPDDVSNEQVVIELNTDYSRRGLAASEIVAVFQAWQNGALSWDFMLDIFRVAKCCRKVARMKKMWSVSGRNRLWCKMMRNRCEAEP